MEKEVFYEIYIYENGDSADMIKATRFAGINKKELEMLIEICVKNGHSLEIINCYEN